MRYGARVIQLGEEPSRVHVCGAPALDALGDVEILDIEALEAQVGVKLDQPPILVTFHPVTYEFENTQAQIDALLSALSGFDPVLRLSLHYCQLR